MTKQLELIRAYHKVVSQARHVMALHRRIEMLIGAVRSDGERLQLALDEVARLEQEIGLDEFHKDTILSGGGNA